MAEALGISFDVGVSVFVFLVHGLYAINKEYKWTQSDEWLEAQKVIFELVYRGLTSSRFGVSITCREINTRTVTRELLPLFII